MSAPGIIGTPSTIFTKDVFGRYICNTWDEATANPDAIDAVVIGAGLYGGYCAAKLYELSKRKLGRSLRILVLEAGPFAVPGHGQNFANLNFFNPNAGDISNQPGAQAVTRNEVWGMGWRSRSVFVGQAYCVGGKGVFWGGWCPRLQAKDLAQWPEEVTRYLTQVDPNEPTGFRPIDHLDVATKAQRKRGDPLSGYETVEYEIGVLPADDFVFDPVQLSGPGPKKVGLNEALRVFVDQDKAGIDGRITDVLPAPIAVQTQSFISGLFALDKYSSVPALQASVRDDHAFRAGDPDLRIALVPNCHVQRVGFLPSGEAPERGTRVINRIDVRVDGVDRQLFIKPHCQVVMAMGAIDTTRLALESFSLAGSGLRAPDNELMGRNFMIHLRANLSFGIDRAAFKTWVEAKWPGFTLAENLQLAAMHIQCDGPHGRYQYQFYAATNANPGADGDSNMYRMIPDLDIQRELARSFDASQIRITLRMSGEVQGGRNAPYRDPDFDFIDLASDFDYDNEFNHRRAWVQFRQDEHVNDHIWQDQYDTAVKIATALNGGVSPFGGFPQPKDGVGTTYHDSGTLWMGDDPDNSVTDAAGHFHHVTNAYACDQSLFPTVGSANPVLTGVCLARRVAEDILNRHAGYSGPRTLNGLVQEPLVSGQWQQAPFDGMTVIDGGGGGLIETNPTQGIGLYYLNRALGDFDLAVEWKAFRTYRGEELIANAGVLLRTPDPAGVNFADFRQFKTFYDAATEIQIDDTGKQFFDDTGRAIFGNSRFKTGAIYGVAPARRWAGCVAAPDGEQGSRYWNLFEISARGPHVKVWLNSKLVSKADVPAGKRLNGFIALQFHTGRVQFRNLQLK